MMGVQCLDCRNVCIVCSQISMGSAFQNPPQLKSLVHKYFSKVTVFSLVFMHRLLYNLNHFQITCDMCCNENAMKGVVLYCLGKKRSVQMHLPQLMAVACVKLNKTSQLSQIALQLSPQSISGPFIFLNCNSVPIKQESPLFLHQLFCWGKTT